MIKGILVTGLIAAVITSSAVASSLDTEQLVKRVCQNHHCDTDSRVKDAIARAEPGTCVLIADSFVLDSRASAKDWWLVLPPGIDKQRYQAAIRVTIDFAKSTQKQVYLSEPQSLPVALQEYCVTQFGQLKANTLGFLVPKIR